MNGFTRQALMALLLASAAGPALAADLPAVEEAPPVVEYQPAPAAFGGWYIRGDLDYHWLDYKEGDYITYGEHPDTGTLHGDLDESWSIGGGVGYQINDYLRTDLTADYLGDADFDGYTRGYCGEEECSSSDKSSMDAWLLLANAYVDLGTYYGFTPYLGAGIGGAYVKWDDLKNTIGHDTTTHDGNDDWRFAAALMAGASYCLTENLDVDVGYRFAHVEGGEMFSYANGAGPGWDDGLNIHEVRAGLRYNFGSGGRPACGAPEPYEPAPVEPVYK